MLLDDWLPDPLTVATWIEKSLITGCDGALGLAAAGCTANVLLTLFDPLVQKTALIA